MKKLLIILLLTSITGCSTLELNSNYSGTKIRKVAAVGYKNKVDEKWADMMTISLINAGFNVVEQQYLLEELKRKGYEFDEIMEKKQYSLLYYLLGIEGLLILGINELDLTIEIVDTEKEAIICSRCCTSATANLNSMSKKLAEKLL